MLSLGKSKDAYALAQTINPFAPKSKVHYSPNLFKATLILCDVIFLVRLQGEFVTHGSERVIGILKRPVNKFSSRQLLKLRKLFQLSPPECFTFPQKIGASFQR